MNLMETKIVINEKLIQDALSVSGLQNKEELINEALMEYIKLKKRKNLTELVGRIEFSQEFDHNKFRELRI